MASKVGYIMEHRKIMAEILGRNLLPNEIIHHKNGIKNDNHPDNLVLMKENFHNRITAKKSWKKKKIISCPHCGKKIKLSSRVKNVEAILD
ncbi:MAG: hypothetical protein FJW69_08980 [Actinobacteria bacterium]|nr:hypothetical protein [Actinomycetota bacterium]